MSLEDAVLLIDQLKEYRNTHKLEFYVDSIKKTEIRHAQLTTFIVHR